MNCEKFENIVSDLARNQMMEAESREQGLAHSRVCEACGNSLRDQRSLAVVLRSYAAMTAQAEAPSHIEAELRSEFRRRHERTPSVVKRSKRRYLVAAIAAMLLLATAVAVRSWRTTRVQQNLAAQDVHRLVPSTAPATEKDSSSPAASPKKASEKRPPVHRLPRPRTIGQVLDRSTIAKNTAKQDPTAVMSNTEEIATEFLPLAYGSPMNLQDGGQLVRVELPRSSLIAFDLPLNVQRSNERVKADVLVGADGLARAIRFVQ